MMAADSASSTDYAKLSDELAEPDPSRSRMQKKLDESPFMVAGIAAGVGIVTYGAYSIRKSNMRPSLYLMQLRVAAQGSIVALLLGGTVVELYGRLKKRFSMSTGEK